MKIACPNKSGILYKELLKLNNNDEDLTTYAHDTITELQDLGLMSLKRYKKPNGEFVYTIPKTITEKSLAENIKGKDTIYEIDKAKYNQLKDIVNKQNISFINPVISKSGDAIFVNITSVKNNKIDRLDFFLGDEALYEQELNEDRELTINRIQEEIKNKPGVQLSLFEQQLATQPIKPGVKELFESNPELANAVYEALGFNQMITPNDKVIFGHPTIGKSYLKKQGEERFITLDDDYKDEVNAFVDANRGSETRQEYKGRKPKEYNEFMLNLYDRLKLQSQKEGKILFVSNTNILKERMSDFDKVINIPKEEFKRRFDERGATYGFEDWKSDIDATVAKIPNNKVITTTGYLADLFITPQQKQQAQQLYSQYLDTIFPDSQVKDIVYHYNASSEKFDKFDKSFIGTQSLGSQDPNQGFSFVDNKLVARAYGSFNTEIYSLPKEVWSTLDKNIYNQYDKNIVTAVINPQKGDWKSNQDGWSEIMIKDPEQIHILGSKQDIEGFKEFVEKTPTQTTDNFNQEDTQIINNLINEGEIKTKCN